MDALRAEDAAVPEESIPTGASGPSDAELVRRCQRGETRAFEELVVRYRGKVYAMIVNMTGNDADAWDLSQEVFLKAWRALAKFEARSQFYTWLYRIAHNVTYDWMRKRKIETGTEFDDETGNQVAAGAVTVPRQAAEPDRRLSSKETGLRIQQALKELSPEHRAVILMKEVDGLSYQEIAEAAGCSLGTVMSRLFYARKRLQSLLRDVYDGAPDDNVSQPVSKP